ncbi:MAG: hypothetical protein F4Y00_00735 [Bacteroidetes bacterium SB0662_bin_6]|nr:hypothetical protein [Bacteroidetes bacterium SB0668_bin_1]MYE03492.1 hypothetical protein [Bacteroidetes bacterium SB0662_bin_6]
MKESKGVLQVMGMLLAAIGLIWTMIIHDKEIERYEAKVAEFEQEVGYCMEQWGKALNTSSNP